MPNAISQLIVSCKFCQFQALNEPFNFGHRGEPMTKLRTFLICVLLSSAFEFAQTAQPQQPESQQGDRKVSTEQVMDDTVQLMRQDIRSQRK